MIIQEWKVEKEVKRALDEIRIANAGLEYPVEYNGWRILVYERTTVTLQVIYTDGDRKEQVYNIAM